MRVYRADTANQSYWLDTVFNYATLFLSFDPREWHGPVFTLLLTYITWLEKEKEFRSPASNLRRPYSGMVVFKFDVQLADN